jgi:hypothetical protein
MVQAEKAAREDPYVVRSYRMLGMNGAVGRQFTPELDPGGVCPE